MKTVAVVPIKFNNRRLPGKNTKLLGGKPLLMYIQETLLKVKGLDEVYIYCSDEKVQDYLIEGVRFQKRPDWLDGDDINANDIFVSFAEDVDADIYVIAHATAPFIKPEHIEEGIRAVKSGEYDSAFAAEKMQDFFWIDGKPFNYNPDHTPRTQDVSPVYKETFGFFVYTKSVVKEHHRRIGYHPLLVEAEGFKTVDIDDADDFAMAEVVLQMMKQNMVGVSKNYSASYYAVAFRRGVGEVAA